MKKKFSELGLSAEILQAIGDMGFEEATAVQGESIPFIMMGKDVVAQAPTGTGKTCAFGIPIIEKIDPKVNAVQALVLCPTRELAVQSAAELSKLAKYKKGIRVLPIYGGQQISRQIYALKNKPQILIATPGRLMDHMERKTVRLESLQMLVLDEADEMLNMGFREDIDKILKTVSGERQTILFSATLSNEIMAITKSYQKDAQLLRIAPKEVTVPTITQYYIDVKSPRKLETLCSLLEINEFRSVMIFCNTKKMVEELCEGMNLRGFRAEGLHGDMKQMQRDKVMAGFKKGSIELLIATDVAARGIDVEDISCVINYDLPSDEEYYVHRIGRTGRANRLGVAYSFVNPKDMYRLRQIMAFTKTPIKLIKAPSPLEVEDAKTLRWFAEISDVISSGAHLRYSSVVERFLESVGEDVTILDVASALLSKMAQQKTSAVPRKSSVGRPAMQTQTEGVKPVSSDWKDEFKPYGKTVKNKKVPTYPTFDGSFDEELFAQADAIAEKAAQKRVLKENKSLEGQRAMSTREPRVRNSAEGEEEKNSARLFLNIGRMDQISRRELSTFLAESLEISEKDIREIEVLDKFSFVTLPRSMAEDAIESLQGVMIDNRRLSVELASGRGERTPKGSNKDKPHKKGRVGDFDSEKRSGDKGSFYARGKAPKKGYISRKPR